MLKDNKAYSLLEILVVVSIIGILSAVGMSAYLEIKVESKLNAVLNSLRGYQSAMISEYLEYSKVDGTTFSTSNIGNSSVEIIDLRGQGFLGAIRINLNSNDFPSDVIGGTGSSWLVMALVPNIEDNFTFDWIYIGDYYAVQFIFSRNLLGKNVRLAYRNSGYSGTTLGSGTKSDVGTAASTASCSKTTGDAMCEIEFSRSTSSSAFVDNCKIVRYTFSLPGTATVSFDSIETDINTPSEVTCDSNLIFNVTCSQANNCPFSRCPAGTGYMCQIV